MSGSSVDGGSRERYREAFLDWLACAVGGREEAVVRAAESTGDRVLVAGTAGHVLDFDDTYTPGLAHLSAPTAPAALILGAELDAFVGDVLDAYAAGFEAMGAVARASHPALYQRGWHPTAVCGTVGAAVAAATLLGLDEDGRGVAARIAILGAGGLVRAFGSDGKSLQVGAAASTGVRAARLAASGARAPETVTDGFERAYGGVWAEPGDEPAVGRNWLKAYPCCLQTHSAINAADTLRRSGNDDIRGVVVAVHPLSRQAAPYDDVVSGLEAKFSIPYTVAFTLLHGPPGVEDLAKVDDGVRELARLVEVRTDSRLGEPAARVVVVGSSGELIHEVATAPGSPERPLDPGQRTAKVRSLAGQRLDGALDDRRPAREVLGLLRV